MERHWLTRPETVRKLWVGFIAVLVATVAAEFFVTHEAHFGLDAISAFHAWLGFISCTVMIAVAKLLGLFVKRRETYYEERND